LKESDPAVHNQAHERKPKWKLKVFFGLLFLFVIIGIFYIWIVFLESGNLVKAAAIGNSDAVRRLLWLGANINLKATPGLSLNGEKEFTPVEIAAFYKQWDICRYLIEHGADPTIRDSEGMVLLHHLVLSSWAGKSDENAAAEIFQLAIKHGAQIDDKDADGQTTLHLACHWLCSHIAEELIKFGANVNARTIQGRTPLHMLAGHDLGEADEAKQRDVEKIFSLLVDKGADINSTTNFGNITPLHDASYAGNLAVIKLLVKHGADINAVGSLASYGKVTPLQCAQKAAKADVVKVLMAFGAK
jgi:serine/threonine-protein phosphatase 6 regulatory ankyrin repeat subunit C